MMCGTTTRVEAERPLDEGTECLGLLRNRWTPGLLLLRLNQWNPGLLLLRLDEWTSLYLELQRMSDVRTSDYVAYTTFYLLGLIMSMQVPFVGFQPIRTSEHMAAAGLCVMLCVFMYGAYVVCTWYMWYLYVHPSLSTPLPLNSPPS